MATLKEIALSGGKMIDAVALERSLRELKTYIDTTAAEPARRVQEQLDALIGAQDGDADKLLNTFNDIKAFLADYDEDDTLKSLLDAVGTAIGTERTRAEAAEQALSARVTTLENVPVMTSAEAKTLFDSVYGGTDSNDSENGSGDTQEGGE